VKVSYSPESWLPIDASGCVGSDQLLKALVKLARAPRFAQQRARWCIVGPLLPRVSGYVQYLNVGAHLRRAARQFPSVDPRHADIGDDKAQAWLAPNAV
jgi:hypothetical protein